VIQQRNALVDAIKENLGIFVIPNKITVIINGSPALNSTSKLMFTWGGVISITVPGQFTVNIP
jgi:hypothetical protein